ncbi:transglycosylase SLT domain-containing protein [Candidatus Pelagadaptatus aseana]|uniref:transglycosylase SLT domain-containing protein n=1 Tax=Candidatus Pelagadaptatus aseana TaxID=3120508 RepID=UPI003C6FFC67
MLIQQTSRYLIAATAWVVGAVSSMCAFFFLTSVAAYLFVPVDQQRMEKTLAVISMAVVASDELREKQIQASIKRLFPHAEEIEKLPYWILSAAQMHDLDPFLLTSVIAQESSFRVNVTSWAGAVGLAQIKPNFWQDECGLDVSDPYNNVICSAFVLKTFKDRYKKLDKALAMYNVGPGNYQRSARYRAAGYRYASSVMSYNSRFTTSG